MDFLTYPFMQQALVVSLLLSLLLGYFGWHVVLRRIVFVDLALAQISALGVAIAILLDQSPLLFALLFTLVAAGILSLVSEGARIPSEAIMGIVYVVATALSILVVSQSPHGEADVLSVLFGNILATLPQQIRLMAIVFAAIAVVHLAFARPMVNLAHAIARGDKPEGRARLWNLIFYLTLALAISLAIRTGGVLLVFSYLIIAPVTGLILSTRPGVVLLIAWASGALASVVGLGVSFRFDLSPGPTIIVCLGALALAVSLGSGVRRRPPAPSA